MIAMKNVLVATDFGEAADNALVYGRELAQRFDATLHVLHVAENVYISAFGAETYASFAPDLQRDLEETAHRRLAEAIIDSDDSGPATLPVVMTSSSPAFAIIDYAREHNLFAEKAYPQQSAQAFSTYDAYVERGRAIANLRHVGRHAEFKYWGMAETVNSAYEKSLEFDRI